MTIHEAFRQMINERSVYKKLEINQDTCRYFRKRSNDNKPLEYETMNKLLLKAGWKDNGWSNPKP